MKNKTTVIVLSMLLLPACAEVKPWQKTVLSKPEMQFSARGHREQMSKHVYFSKEASDGGFSVSGGGCGCN